MKWRFIPFRYYEPNFRLALNEVAFESVQNSEIPIISLSGWKPSCINIGYTQKINEVLNLDEIKKRDILIVRRESCGGATYLSENGEISWSIIANENYFPKNLQKIYEFVTKIIISTLNEIGIEAFFKPINDILTKNGKISGTALKKSNKCIYIHGTLLYKIDKKLINLILKPENDHQKKQKIKEIDKKVTSICDEINGISFEKVIEILTKNLLKNKNYKISEWTQKELKKAKKLSEKYKNKNWVYKF